MRLSHHLILTAALMAAAPAIAQNYAAPAATENATAANVAAPTNEAAPINTAAPAPASAPAPSDQTTAPPPAPRSFPWGVLGLLGLVGLFGRKRSS